MITTFGREQVRRALPDGYKEWADKPLDKKAIEALTTELAKKDPDAYVDILQRLHAIGENTVSLYGRDAALSFSKAMPSKAIRSLNAQLKALVDKILDDESLTEEQKEKKILDIGYKYSQKIQDEVFNDQDHRHTALASQINSGSRGNKTQLMQLMFGNMVMKDALNRDMPMLHMDPYMFGTSPMAYWVSASSGRKGMYDVQAATGQAGYLGKQVTNVTHDVVIEKDDCGTRDTGVPFKAADPQNIGRVLLRPFHNHPAGEVVDAKMIAEADDDEEMILRTPMTCKCAHGICAKCNGLSENGRFPGIGDYVALTSARAFVEKVTQAGISCLHPDTLVKMADGINKHIKDIKVGDEVYGVDYECNCRPVKVLHVFDNGIQPMYEVTLTNGKGMAISVKLTDKHRVLVCCEHDKYCQRALGRLDDETIGIESSIDACVPVVDKGKIIEFRIAKVEFIGDQQAYDIEVDHPDHLFLLANGLVVSNSKHGSGIGGKKVIDPEGEDQPTGFPAIERMFQAQENFPGGAVLSPVDGTVTNIRPAPQGGNYITVGPQTLYCAPERTFKVKVGDKVSAGDVLTNGVPNPKEVVEYKGIGQGRRYYMEKLADVFKRAGFGVDRSNLEAYSRAAMNKVRITDDNGYHSWLPGDVVNYSAIAAEWKPREDAVSEAPDKAANKYLEEPVLYYTIGTRITPAVAQALKKYGFGKITVSPTPPPFTAEYMRPAAALQNDEHWLPRLAGERLKDSLFDAARKGITDPYDSTSFVDKIVTLPFK